MEPQVLQDFRDQKDLLVEWACQEHLERKVCLASLAHKVHLAYLEKKVQKEQKGKQAHLA